MENEMEYIINLKCDNLRLFAKLCTIQELKDVLKVNIEQENYESCEILNRELQNIEL